MEDNFDLIPIFPITIFKTKLPSKLSNIVPWLDSQLMDSSSQNQSQIFGERSANKYILNSLECKELKDEILKNTLKYGKILGIQRDKYKITQSWITLKQPNQNHTKHLHSNSLLSGVLYYGDSYKEDCYGIDFHSEENLGSNGLIVPITPTEFSNKYNGSIFRLNPNPGDLILFPSSLYHSVPKNTTNKVRKSLAFNIVPTEGFGEEETLNELKFN